MSDRDLAAELTGEGLRSRLEIPEGAVDPFETLERLGVAVLRCPLDVEGVYCRVERQAFAVINSLVDVTRQRFTAAHELGHHVLYDESAPPSYVDVDLNEADDDPLEQAADAFATGFLMPAAQVRRYATNVTDARTKIIRTMWQFDVSKPAAAERCVELDLVTGAERDEFRRDPRTITRMFQDCGLQPRGQRKKGQRFIDPVHRARVARLVSAGILSDPNLFLDLT